MCAQADAHSDEECMAEIMETSASVLFTLTCVLCTQASVLSTQSRYETVRSDVWTCVQADAHLDEESRVLKTLARVLHTLDVY